MTYKFSPVHGQDEQPQLTELKKALAPDILHQPFKPIEKRGNKIQIGNTPEIVLHQESPHSHIYVCWPEG